MGDNTKPVPSRKRSKQNEKLKKFNVYKDTALSAIRDNTQFDTAIVKSNENYMIKLREADKSEYELLKINMQKAESADEREKIRNYMVEMRKERDAKDTENKAFYEKLQENHENYNLKIIGSVAVVLGFAYKYRKPILDAGKKLITNKV